MSANPTRSQRPATASEPADPSHHAEGERAGNFDPPLPDGNRVLESIARREAMPGLLAFSSFHMQIRDRRVTRRVSDGDLLATERFILDEVLQLICDRVHAISQADGIVVALTDGLLANELKAGTSKPEQPRRDRSNPECPAMVCRASAGPLAVERGVSLAAKSGFLRECLETGRILCCDDCEIDTRVELDSARHLGAGSTLLIPLRGQGQRLGVLQVFSRTPWAFAKRDIRCFDLFADMILSALRPEDQDRRIQWLAEIAGEVLQARPASTAEKTTVEAGLTPAFEIAQTMPKERSAAERPSLPLEASFPRRPSPPGRSHPGLSVVMGLVAVAALFSAGTWWGMEFHGKAAINKVATASLAAANSTILAQEVTTPALPANVPSLASSDNLMSPSKLGSGTAPLAAVAEEKLMALPKITGVRHWSSSIGSTLVIDMEDQVPYEVHRLISPERIYFDLHDTVLTPELNGKTIEVGDPSLTRVRVAQPVAGVTRIVLDTRDGSNFSVSMESNPYRLVVELGGRGKTAAANKSVPNQVTSNADVPNQTLPRPSIPNNDTSKQVSANPASTATSGRLRIVLDPGHGGWDLGTVGRQGLLEKDLVLDVTQRLGKLLQARLGTEVMFTRTDDTYLPLDQRADLANRAQADLFVSIHANYSTSAAARGVETYYTNVFSAPGARDAEQHDDGTFANLTPASLSAGGLHEKIEESRRLAASVQHSLYTTLAANSPNIRNRGIKDSAFVVLTGTTMPAILTEISFVSSPADERNLQSEAYRQRIAEALYQGIARYEVSTPHAKIAQLQKPAVR